MKTYLILILILSLSISCKKESIDTLENQPVKVSDLLKGKWEVLSCKLTNVEQIGNPHIISGFLVTSCGDTIICRDTSVNPYASITFSDNLDIDYQLVQKGNYNDYDSSYLHCQPFYWTYCDTLKSKGSGSLSNNDQTLNIKTHYYQYDHWGNILDTIYNVSSYQIKELSDTQMKLIGKNYFNYFSHQWVDKNEVVSLIKIQ